MAVLMVVAYLMAQVLCGCGYFAHLSFYKHGKGEDIPTVEEFVAEANESEGYEYEVR